MKKLFIMRHAKSSWDNIFLNDYDRPLNSRGKSDLRKMAIHFSKKNIKPNLLLSSGAKRAKKTAKVIIKKLKFTNIFIVNDTIYESNEDNLLFIIKNLENIYHTVFLIGHNPGLNMLVYDLINFDKNIPTCGVIELEFNCNTWQEINKNNVEFVSFEFPKKIK